MNATPLFLTGLGLIYLTAQAPGHAGTLAGHVRDQNWYARRTDTDPLGVGYYEFAVNGNASGLSALGGLAATDVLGAFQMPDLPAGAYTVASWDVWWRSAYAFNVAVPASGTAPEVDLRLTATMWGYPSFWDDTGYAEFGQTFTASGPITMIYLRAPYSTSYVLTVHENGPDGPQVGARRDFAGVGDFRLIYSRGDLPTVAGRLYYARVRTASGIGGVLRQMDPRPDFSDPMPGGCLWVGSATQVISDPDRDLGLIIMSDDDGLLTALFARSSGPSWSNATSVGQTWVARGVNLISAAFWLADPAAPAYVVRVRQGGPGGGPVGPEKRGKPARLFADPEMVVTWGPGECPLVPGEVYYVEVTSDGGGPFNVIYVNTGDPYAEGDAYRDGVPVRGTDLAGTLVEEETLGSATRPAVRITADPVVPAGRRGSNEFTVEWSTDVAADSRVEYAVEHPPYALVSGSTELVTTHSITLSNLQPHTLYHYQVSSARPDHRPAVSRDVVVCTRPAARNLLVNPGFEEGIGPSPQSVIPGWTKGGSIDIKVSDGTWFWGLAPNSGTWLLEGAVNGTASDGFIYQRVAGVSPGQEYTFSAWVMTAMRENNTWKYDVWNDPGRLIHLRLGLDPTGGTDPTAPTVRWTPRLYSHRRYTNLAKSAAAQGTNLTVFVSLKGTGGQWHLYAVDDCVLTHEEILTRLREPWVRDDGVFQASVLSRANRTNVIEISTNLAHWTSWTTLLNRTGITNFSGGSVTHAAARYFRARTLP
jgi:hypothetical protein